LLFARTPPPSAHVIDVQKCLREISLLLRRLIGPKIELKVVCDPEAPLIYFDPGQFEQIIMNLVINGRDAMPLGGILTTRTRTIF